MRFILIRHGQSGNNLLWEQTGGVAGRHPDAALTPLGHEQAARLQAAVAAGTLPWQPTHLYTSLMTRAVETAAPLAEVLDLDLIGHPDLFECGAPYDVHDDGTRSHHPGSGRAALQALSERLILPDTAGPDGWWAGPYEAEENAWSGRAAQVIADLRTSHAENDVVVLVTHGYFTQFLIRSILGIAEITGWFAIKNTAISLLRDDQGTWAGTSTAVVINWLPHLDGPLITD